MAAEQRSEAGTGQSPEFASHEMRITQGGKIRAWVEFALKFFEENEEKELVLHTLPAATKGKSKQNERREAAESDDNEHQSAPQLARATDAIKDTGGGFSASTTVIPRLITVVEIIKREYLAAMSAKQSPQFVGLFQYNEIGSLEDQAENEKEGEGEESASDRMTMITEALAGSKNVQVAKTPYMKVTLCRKELEGMKDSGATGQAPLKRKISRSGKGRAKKAARKVSENGKRE